jgi:dTDP-4-dehydrorhamnose reductase
MRVLVLGVSGMLGSMVFRQFQQREGWKVSGTIRSGLAEGQSPADDDIWRGVRAEDLGRVREVMEAVRPAIVVNCIGLVKQAPDSRDPLRAIPINSLFPHQLASLCRIGGTRLVHVSTDCVFSGKAGNYSEDDVPDAADLYGRSKLLGEVEEDAITIRTSIIGPETAGAGYGLFDWFMRQQGPITGYARAVFSGVTTLELTRVLAEFILPFPNLRGIFHVGAAPISKYDLLRLLSEVYSRPITIHRDEKYVIDRSLDSSRFRTATGYAPPEWPIMLDAMRRADVQLMHPNA